MHDYRLISLFLRLFLIAAAVLSCTKEIDEAFLESETVPDPNLTYQVEVEFNILDPDTLPQVKSDTKSDDPLADGKLDKTEHEKAINNIFLFVKDVESGTIEATVPANLIPADFTSTGVRCGYTFQLSSGIKQFYVGANMTEEHIAYFCADSPIKAATHEEVLAKLLDNSTAKDGTGTNIMMFSKPATDADKNSDIDITGKRSLYLTAQLKRSIAKVLVLGKSSGEIQNQNNNMRTNAANTTYETRSFPGYITYDRLKDGKLDYADDGWFEISSGSFILQNTTRQSYISEHFDSAGENPFPEDPNWKLSEWVEKDDATGVVRLKNMIDYNDHFEALGTSDIISRLNSEKFRGQVLVRDDGRLDINNQGNHYTEGLYCLENTVYDDFEEGFWVSRQIKDEAAKLTTTHLYLRFRFLPKHIQGEANTSLSTWGGYNPVTPEESKEQLNYEGANTNNNEDAYTFWTRIVDGRLYCYNYEGAKRVIGDGSSLTWSNFTKHEGGWVYFSTFIEGGQLTPDEENNNELTYDGDKYWGIRRNDYCILTVTGISNWGSNTPGTEYIKVMSQTLTNWNNRGNKEIQVNPVK